MANCDREYISVKGPNVNLYHLEYLWTEPDCVDAALWPPVIADVHGLIKYFLYDLAAFNLANVCLEKV